MAVRSDIHRPSVIVADDYAPVGALYQGASEEMHHEYRHDHAALDEALGDNWHENLVEPDGNYAQLKSCDHCGARFAHGIVYRHLPSDRVIVVGHICAAKLLLGVDQAVRARLAHEAAAKAAVAAKANASERAKILAANPGLEDALLVDHSEKQIALVFKIGPEHAEREARIAAEKAFAQPAILGKGVEIVGRVLSRKWQEGYHGDVLKMLVLDDRHFKVWGSVPSAIDVSVGDRVQFVANVEPSDDESFAFFKRPRKALNLSAPDDQEVAA